MSIVWMVVLVMRGWMVASSKTFSAKSSMNWMSMKGFVEMSERRSSIPSVSRSSDMS